MRDSRRQVVAKGRGAIAFVGDNNTININGNKLEVRNIYFCQDKKIKGVKPEKKIKSKYIDLYINYEKISDILKPSDNFKKFLDELGCFEYYNLWLNDFLYKYEGEKYSVMATSLMNSCTNEDGAKYNKAIIEVKNLTKENGKDSFFVFLSAMTKINMTQSSSYTIDYHVARILKKLLDKRGVKAFWWEDNNLCNKDWYISTKIAAGLALSSIFISLAFDTVEILKERTVNFKCWDEEEGSPCFKYELDTFKSFCEDKEKHKKFVEGFYTPTENSDGNYNEIYPTNREWRVFSYGKPISYKGCNSVFNKQEIARHLKEVDCLSENSSVDKAKKIITSVLDEIYFIICEQDTTKLSGKYKSPQSFSALTEDELNIINEEFHFVPQSKKGICWKQQQPCEFFFEYAVVPSPDNAIKEYPEPNLFVECDKDGKYRMFAEIPEWRCGNGKETDDLEKPIKEDFLLIAKSKQFTQVKTYFERFRHGSLKNNNYLQNIKNNIFNIGNNETPIDYADYCMGLRRIDIQIETINNTLNSGIGNIILFNTDNGLTQKYAFFVNFSFRKRIVYQFLTDRQGNKTGIAICENNIDKNQVVKVCLKSSISNPKCDTLKTLTLSHKTKKPIDLLCQLGKGNYYITFENKQDEKKYLLEQMDCKHNTKGTMTNKVSMAEGDEDLICPFCHRKIKWLTQMSKEYYHYGGISCQGKQVSIRLDGGGANDSSAKNCIICDNCLNPKSSTPNNIYAGSRLLPYDFLNSDSFRLAVVGSPRSGKTFWLARLFPISKGTLGKIPLTKSPLNKFWNKSDYVSSEAGWRYNVKDKRFIETEFEDEFLKGFQWDVTTGRCPTPTTTKEDESKNLEYLESRPLSIKLNKKTAYGKDRAQYVHIYDMPGERFKKSDEDETLSKLPLVDNPNRLGAIFIFNDNGNFSSKQIRTSIHDTFNEFLDRMVMANATDVPLAIVVTKFDEYEKNFDSNAHCLRNDVLRMAKYTDVSGQKELFYSGSALQNNIDMASAEIECYLRETFCDPDENVFDLIDKKQTSNMFTNIKFFGVSALRFKQSIKHFAEGSSEVNIPQFFTSPKRTELPFIWMMHEFGLIN